MRILVACEFSGIVRDAFAKLGHYALSCDLLPTERPGNHYQGDVRDIITDGWDLMVAHPPCTYLAKAGARWLYGGGRINTQRLELGEVAKDFFLSLLNANIPRIAIENPTPLKVWKLPKETQVIQPHEFGHPYSKRTLLWLRGLPLLTPTEIINEYEPFLPSNTGGKKRGQAYSFGVSKNSTDSSRTFIGIANAMAEQWGKVE